MRPLVLALLCIIGVGIPVALQAQSATEAAKTEGKSFGREKAAAAQQAATTAPDPDGIPNFGGTPGLSGYFDDPERMAQEAASAASSNSGYRIMRDSLERRARFEPEDLDAVIARSETISKDPLYFTSGMSITGSEGRCVALPPASGTSARYMATCNVGFAATQEEQSCTIPLGVKVETITRQIYWCSEADFHRLNGVDDCALFAWAGCQTIGTRPGRCLQWRDENGIGYCVEPGEPISELSCRDTVEGANLRDTATTQVTHATRDESQCAELAADGQCIEQAETCTDSDPVTRIVRGVAVTQPCWAWSRRYLCGAITEAQDCDTLESTPGCTLVREDCLSGKPCQTWERVYDCPVPDQPASPDQYICDGDVYCIDGSCETIEREANDEFKDAVVALNAMDQARREFDPDTLTLFAGTRNSCSSKIFGVLSCCRGKGFPLIPGIQLLVALGCSQEETLLHERDAQGLCAYVGSYCSDSFLGACLTKKKVYCCFESKLSRILQEQGREQLNKPWGKPKTEECLGFTIDEFSRLDLSQMDFSEVYAEFTEAARLPDELAAAADIQQKIEDYYARASQ
ncbi:conjugal transfer protein TraN [Croceicoccus hydrothermalis]|uniref:conjugal transfer protein TraN n=1 Tax=Croceicoccus hydrothermalis TaxID=2867964 RepID=UPI001EFBB4C6|nr:conjugal transfer protein TraN [Croceicoccus hydrothermalis]